MANIKNFGLVGVAADVQFGKAGPRLVNDAQVFKFKDVSGAGVAPIVAGNATVAGLTVGANGTITMGSNKVTNVAAGTDLTDAINLGQLNTAIDAVTGTGSTLAAEVDKIEAAIGLNTDGTLAAFANDAEAGPAAGATSYKNAIELVSAALKGEIDRALAAEALVAGDLTAEVTRAKAAEKKVADDLAAEITRATGEEADIRADFAAADTAIRAELQAAIAGITWENPVNQMVADVAARDALTGLLDGARIYVTADNKVYTKTAEGFDAGEVMVQGAAFFDRETTVPYVFNGEDMVQFNGAAGLTAGLGLIMNGNTMDLDLSTEGGLKFYPDAGNPNNTVGLKLDGTTLVVGTAGLKLADSVLSDVADDIAAAVLVEENRAKGVEAALQSELDATQTGAGLSAAGAYIAGTDPYLSGATSLFNADSLLAAKLKEVADDLAALGTGSVSNLQIEVDALETSLGSMVDADGVFVPFTGTNYLDAATDVTGAISALDAALKAADSAIDGRLDLIEAKTYAINDMTDVTIATVADKNFLRYNGTTSQWENVDVTTDGIAEGSANKYFTDARARLALAVEAVAGADDAKLSYDSATGVLGLVNAASIKLVEDTAAQTLADAKAYADQVAATAANSVKHVAKSVYAEFAYTDNPAKSIALDVQGRVHRVKVMIDTGFASTGDEVTISVGTTAAPAEVMNNDSIDMSTPGVYVVELNKLYATATELKVFIGGTLLTAGAGAVIVEYFTA